MNVEITNEQKAALGNKIALCVEFLKKEIQPHLTSSSKSIVSMGEYLELYITCKEIYVKRITSVSLGLDFEFKKVLYLEKDRKKANKYICDAEPELAIEFLQHWDKAKTSLLEEVSAKNQEVEKLNDFIDNFQL